MKHNTINDAYVRKHARPGEEWVEARCRLEGEVYYRLSQIPDCPECAHESPSMAIAQESHARGACSKISAAIDEWPAEALSANLLAAHYEHRQRHVDAQQIIARKHVAANLMKIDAQTAPINALTSAIAALGYLNACGALGVFEGPDMLVMRMAVVSREEQAMLAFLRQVRAGDPNAVPWTNLDSEAKTT